MGKYELTNEDKCFSDLLVKATKYVENVYYELCEAEVCHEYDEYILSHIYELLYDALEEEKRVLNYLKDGDNRINDIIDYISKKYDCQDIPLDDFSVSMLDTSKRNIKRALTLLNNKRVNYKDVKKDDDIINKMFVNSILLKDSIDIDYYMGYLYFMQEYINDQMDLSVRRELIKCKYNLYYLNPKLENMMLDRSFIVNNQICFESKIISDYLGYSDEVYYDLFHFEGYTNANDNIDNIINLKAEELNKDCVRLLSFSAFAKSALLMMPDIAVSSLEERTINKLQDNYFKTDILQRVFRDNAINKSKSMSISLRCN